MTWTYKDVLDALEDDDEHMPAMIDDENLSHFVLKKAKEAREGILVETYQQRRGVAFLNPAEAEAHQRCLFEEDLPWQRIVAVLEARFPARPRGRPGPKIGKKKRYRVGKKPERNEAVIRLPVDLLGCKEGDWVEVDFREAEIVVKRT